MRKHLVASVAAGVSLQASNAHALDFQDVEIEHIQQLMDQQVGVAIAAHVDGDLGPRDGLHWRVDFDSTIAVQGNPTFACNGGGCEAFLAHAIQGFEFAISLPVRVQLDSHAYVNSWWSPELHATGELHSDVLMTVHVPFGPLLSRAGELTFDIEQLGGNVEVDGLQRVGATLGSLVGEFGLGVGWGIGAGLGAIAGNQAEPHVERAIEREYKKLLGVGAEAIAEQLNAMFGTAEIQMRREALWHAPGIVFSNSGPVDGMHCVQLDEGSDIEGTWADNYLCTSFDMGIAWSSAGPIPGMTCTQVYEDAEPEYTTWQDNYLCQPYERAFDFAWSQAGPIDGYECVAFDEASDPHTWGDNYLCHRNPIRKGPRR